MVGGGAVEINREAAAGRGIGAGEDKSVGGFDRGEKGCVSKAAVIKARKRVRR